MDGPLKMNELRVNMVGERIWKAGTETPPALVAVEPRIGRMPEICRQELSSTLALTGCGPLQLF